MRFWQIQSKDKINGISILILSLKCLLSKDDCYNDINWGIIWLHVLITALPICFAGLLCFGSRAARKSKKTSHNTSVILTLVHRAIITCFGSISKLVSFLVIFIGFVFGDILRTRWLFSFIYFNFFFFGEKFSMIDDNEFYENLKINLLKLVKTRWIEQFPVECHKTITNRQGIIRGTSAGGLLARAFLVSLPCSRRYSPVCLECYKDRPITTIANSAMDQSVQAPCARKRMWTSYDSF